jgi:hypothetical protein
MILLSSQSSVKVVTVSVVMSRMSGATQATLALNRARLSIIVNGGRLQGVAVVLLVRDSRSDEVE